MNTATLVEETLRGLPDKITVYMPWDPELEEPGLWEDWPGEVVHQFPCLFSTYEECEREITSFAIDTFQAAQRGEVSLPSSIDYVRQFTLHRNGNMFTQPMGSIISMFWLVNDRQNKPEHLTNKTFNREFAHYYAGLVAQQRNKQ